MDSYHCGSCPVASSCNHSYEHSGFINGEGFLDLLSHQQVFKDCAAYSYNAKSDLGPHNRMSSILSLGGGGQFSLLEIAAGPTAYIL